MMAADAKAVSRGRILRLIENRGHLVWMKTKSAFSALGTPTSPAWMRWGPRVEELALPKSVDSGKLSLEIR